MPVARLMLVLTLGLAACDRAGATSPPLPQRVVPRTLIVSAEIGESGPTGVYAVRL